MEATSREGGGPPAASSKDGEQSQSGLLQLWWSLMQDQVAALTREIESVRLANSQTLACQLDATKQRAEAQDEKMMESMNLISQFGQELKSIKFELQTEKEERAVAYARLSDIIKAEPQKRAEVHEEYQRGLLQVKERMDEELRTRQEVLERQGEKLGQILNAFRNDVQVELDSQRASVREVAQDVSGLRLALDTESTDRTEKLNEYAEIISKNAVDVDSQKQSQLSFHNLVQGQLEFINTDMMSEREAWSQRRTEMQQRVLQCVGEQAQLLAEERQSREAQHESVLGQIGVEKHARERQCALDREELRRLVTDMCTQEQERTNSMLARAQNIIDSDQELQAKLQNLLQIQTVSKADFIAETQRLWDAVRSSPGAKEPGSLKGTFRPDPSASVRAESGSLKVARAEPSAVVRTESGSLAKANLGQTAQLSQSVSTSGASCPVLVPGPARNRSASPTKAATPVRLSSSQASPRRQAPAASMSLLMPSPAQSLLGQMPSQTQALLAQLSRSPPAGTPAGMPAQPAARQQLPASLLLSADLSPQRSRGSSLDVHAAAGCFQPKMQLPLTALLGRSKDSG